MRIRIGGTHFPLETLGPGRRLGVWFQGCPLACAGCMSRHTWDAGGGRDSSVGELLAVWRDALAGGAEGLTVSGGEPLEQAAGLAGFLAGADAARGGVGRDGTPDILVYTGYEQDEWDPDRLRALRYADAVVAGRFRIAEPTGLVWRGSANQRLLPRTALGRARYGPHLHRRATGPSVQVVVEPAGGPAGAASGASWETPREEPAAEPARPPAARLLGVPARGELAFYERWLGERGLRLRERSWRP
ncbi:4Fe-4S single cluster domain-containing protein [Streptomyces sp. NPDC094032]|uniref:4Fe-4S single cluster domain-containing protein n=1 Tax=Streptomyces sp. NPDC094032 TaxID=3155308 RepID=UPI0033213BAF